VFAARVREAFREPGAPTLAISARTTHSSDGEAAVKPTPASQAPGSWSYPARWPRHTPRALPARGQRKPSPHRAQTMSPRHQGSGHGVRQAGCLDRLTWLFVSLGTLPFALDGPSSM